MSDDISITPTTRVPIAWLFALGGLVLGYLGNEVRAATAKVQELEIRTVRVEEAVVTLKDIAVELKARKQ